MTEPIKASPLPRATLKHGAGFGLAAGAAMILFSLVARLAWGALSITELAADWFTTLLPGHTLDFLLENLSFSAKPLMFLGLSIAQVMVGGIFGVAYVWLANRRPAPDSAQWLRATAFGAVLWLVSMLVLVPAFGGGLFASGAPGGTGAFLLASLGAYGVFALTLGFLVDRAARLRMATPDPSERRAFLRTTGTWLLVGAAAAYGLKYLFDQVGTRVGTSGAFRTRGVLSQEVTPNDQFYIVSKNFIDPEVGAVGWSLEVGGLVEESLSLTYAELTSMPTVKQFVTLECISNEVGGDLISNARWRGVPLKLILERAGMRPGVVDVSFRSYDGYTESMPLTKAMSDEVIVAFEMNGALLPLRHGFPARLIVPGWFGLKHVKWLTAIEPVDHDFQGFWQQRGWTDAPYVKTFSRFDIPQSGIEISANPIMVGGVAFAGDRGISAVEISDDEGLTWAPVEYISKPLSAYTWVIWTRELVPSSRGSVLLRVRATDGEGIVQTAERIGSIPDGATGRHEIPIYIP